MQLVHIWLHFWSMSDFQWKASKQNFTAHYILTLCLVFGQLDDFIPQMNSIVHRDVCGKACLREEVKALGELLTMVGIAGGSIDTLFCLGHSRTPGIRIEPRLDLVF